jgi:capsular exopolysaccharide synthesis family protein
MTAINPAIRPAAVAPGARGVAGPGAGVTLDPVRLLRQYKWLFLVSIAVGVVVGVGAYLVLQQLTPVYRSTVVYELATPIVNINPLEATGVDRDEFERFAATQARLVVSEVVLNRVVTSQRFLRSNFAQRYMSGGTLNTAEAIRGLSEAAVGRVIAGTRFMELTVSASTPREAQELAMMIDMAYFRHLDDTTGVRTGARLEPIAREIRALDDQLVRLQQQQQRLIGEKRMEGAVDAATVARNRVMELSKRLDENRGLQAQVSVQLEQLQSDVAREGGPVGTERHMLEAERDPMVQTLRERLLNLQIEDKAQAGAGLLEDHPSRVRLREVMRIVEAELSNERQKALSKAVQNDLDRARVSLDQLRAEERQLQAQLEEAQVRATDLTSAASQLQLLNEQRARLIERRDRLQAQEQEAQVATSMHRRGEIDNIEINRLEVQQRGRVAIVQTANLPDSLSFPRLAVFIPLGIVVVLGLTIAGVAAREVLDQRVKGPADVSAIPRVRVLGMVPVASEDPMKPAMVETAFRDSPTGAVSEAYRQARAQIAKAMAARSARSLLVVGAAPEAGASTTVCNLAMGFAASEQQVLVIDANFRRPSLHRVFKLGEGPGLGEVLARQKTLEQAVQQTSVPGVSLLSAGSSSFRAVPERLATEAMTQLIEAAAKKYDVVIVDTAPAMIAGDAMALVNRCDASLLVVRAMVDKRGLVARVSAQLMESRAEFLGVLVTCVRTSAGGYLRKNIKAAYDYQSGTPS